MPFGVPECDYVPSLCMFRIRKVIGKHFFAGGFGMTLSSSTSTATDKNECTAAISQQHHQEKKQSSEYLFIEEALFLMERGVLQIYSEHKTLLSPQQVYDMLTSIGVPISIYLTYAHLRRQDYRVLRHVASNDNKDVKEARRTMQMQTLNENASCIAFDVYPPNTHFKKTNPGIPHLRVAVASFQLPSLTFGELQTLSKQNKDGVPLKIATVSDSGVVVMFAITSVGVPSLNNHNDDIDNDYYDDE